MTVQTSSINAALTYLVNAATTAFNASGQLVLDGLPKVVDQQTYPEVITIGWDGDLDTITPAVEGDQDFAALNRSVTRNENFRIVCSVMHWDGEDTVTNARNAAFGLLATFEKLLRGYPPNGTGDVTLGGAVTFAQIAGGIAVDYTADANGVACRIVFHVTCYTRLTGA